MRALRLSSWAIVMACLLALLAAGQRAVFAIEAEMYPVPEKTHSGAGWTAIQYGLDGKVYVGTGNYGHSGHLVCFDPETKEWKDIIDAHQVTRENGTGLDSQGKFHAKPQVDADGVIWAGTLQAIVDVANRAENGEDATGYPGGHLFSYDPKTGVVRDHGILKKQQGIMGGAIDRERRRLYYWSYPKLHFLIYDIEANTLRDLGQIGGGPRYMAIDPKGRVFGMGRFGIFWMYDPETDRLYDLAVQVRGDGEHQEPYVIVMSADGERIFASAIQGEYVMEFDLKSIDLKAEVPGADGTIVCYNVCRSIPEPLKPGDQHAGALGKDGRYYYTNPAGGGTHLIRYDPQERAIEDLGVITIKGNPELNPTDAPQLAQGACVGTDGTLYMMFIQHKKLPYCVLVFDKLTAPKGEDE